MTIYFREVEKAVVSCRLIYIKSIRIGAIGILLRVFADIKHLGLRMFGSVESKQFNTHQPGDTDT